MRENVLICKSREYNNILCCISDYDLKLTNINSLSIDKYIRKEIIVLLYDISILFLNICQIKVHVRIVLFAEKRLHFNSHFFLCFWFGVI